MFRQIKLIINESEITAGTRGASLGPGAMKVAARNKNSLLFGEYEQTHIAHENDLLDRPVKYPFGKRIDGLVKVFNRVSDQVASSRKAGNMTLVIAADHGSAGGTIAGLKKANPNHRIGVVWIDAHGDLHTPYTTPSGNMHGMPLATALNENNLACQINEVQSDVADMWDELKNCGGTAPKIKDTDLFFIGVRDTEEPEDKLIERRNIKNYEVAELREKGAAKVLAEIDAKLADCDEIYISFDVDSMDPKYTSHGTGTPVENGLMPEESEALLLHYASHPKVHCIEFVEVNPCLDEKTNKMAEVAFDLLEKVVERINE